MVLCRSHSFCILEARLLHRLKSLPSAPRTTPLPHPNPAHFYFMEVKPGPYAGKLAIRPWGYLAAVGAAVGLGGLLMTTDS